MKYLLTAVLFLVLVVGQNLMAGVLFTATPSPSTTTINHPVAVNVSAFNAGTSQLYVTNVRLTATSTSNTSSRLPVAFSVWNPNNTGVTIGAGPNVATTLGLGTAIFFSPSTGITGSGTGTYTIGGTVYLSDGSVNQITNSAAVTINPIPLPAYERQ